MQRMDLSTDQVSVGLSVLGPSLVGLSGGSGGLLVGASGALTPDMPPPNNNIKKTRSERRHGRSSAELPTAEIVVRAVGVC